MLSFSYYTFQLQLLCHAFAGDLELHFKMYMWLIKLHYYEKAKIKLYQ